MDGGIAFRESSVYKRQGFAADDGGVAETEIVGVQNSRFYHGVHLIVVLHDLFYFIPELPSGFCQGYMGSLPHEKVGRGFLFQLLYGNGQGGLGNEKLFG